MNADAVQRLNALNQAFYRITADAFDQTRQTPWSGWDGLLPYLRPPLRVLDAGCGNGRFGVYLWERLRPADDDAAAASIWLTYHGLDSSPALLARALAALAGRPGLAVHLEERDLLDSPPDAGEYDLAALLGVLHHVPGAANRRRLVQALAARLAPGGLLAFATWRFYEHLRFRERIVPWPDDLAGQVEPHDYLLDWRRGEPALRYCHYIDDAEHDALVAACGLRELARYRADGANCYSILQRA